MRWHLALVLPALLIAGCADIEPFDPPVAGEMNPEPGLFSGLDGQFVLYRGAVEEAPTAAPAKPPRRLTDPPPP
jgi:hypothetical protein